MCADKSSNDGQLLIRSVLWKHSKHLILEFCFMEITHGPLHLNWIWYNKGSRTYQKFYLEFVMINGAFNFSDGEKFRGCVMTDAEQLYVKLYLCAMPYEPIQLVT